MAGAIILRLIHTCAHIDQYNVEAMLLKATQGVGTVEYYTPLESLAECMLQKHLSCFYIKRQGMSTCRSTFLLVQGYPVCCLT